MTTSKKPRLSLEERIKQAQEKLTKLRQQKKIKQVTVTKDMTGMTELLSLIDKVASDNKIKVGDIVLFVSKTKRTGLKLVSKGTKTK
jgi:hypothetical protein